MQRAIKGLCVAWKPLIAPHAMLTNMMGKTGSAEALGWVFCNPSHTSGSAGWLT